ncbi:MAG: septum site-determining protein MinC [Lachnospiraceae bacterium]|nr:septum site-determining protein MinC [Lachnospiraceae bacterium]
MNQPVTLKGVKSGIILKLSGEGDFEKLLPEIEKKFKESASFFGNKHMILSIEGRDVDDEEAAQILELLVNNTRLKVDTIMVQDRVLEDKFQAILGDDPRHEIEIARLRKDNAVLLKAIGQLTSALDPMNVQVHKGTLRGGNDIEALGSVMILGDVKPGATVIAGGSIFVFGSLQGTADAGAYGDAEAFIMAFNMDPMQVRISDAIAVSEKSGKRRRGFMRPKDMIIPEVASIVDGHIVIQDFDSTFIKEMTFFKKSKKVTGPLMEETAADMIAAMEQNGIIDMGLPEVDEEPEIDFTGQGDYETKTPEVPAAAGPAGTDTAVTDTAASNTAKADKAAADTASAGKAAANTATAGKAAAKAAAEDTKKEDTAAAEADDAGKPETKKPESPREKKQRERIEKKNKAREKNRKRPGLTR